MCGGCRSSVRCDAVTPSLCLRALSGVLWRTGGWNLPVVGLTGFPFTPHTLCHLSPLLERGFQTASLGLRAHP